MAIYLKPKQINQKYNPQDYNYQDGSLSVKSATLLFLQPTSPSITSINSSITTLNNQVNILNTEYTSVSNTITGYTGTINTINSSLSSINNSINVINTNVSTINSTITGYTGTINTINSSLSSINNNISIINTNVSNINTLLTGASYDPVYQYLNLSNNLHVYGNSEFAYIKLDGYLNVSGINVSATQLSYLQNLSLPFSSDIQTQLNTINNTITGYTGTINGINSNITSNINSINSINTILTGQSYNSVNQQSINTNTEVLDVYCDLSYGAVGVLGSNQLVITTPNFDSGALSGIQFSTNSNIRTNASAYITAYDTGNNDGSTFLSIGVSPTGSTGSNCNEIIRINGGSISSPTGSVGIGTNNITCQLSVANDFVCDHSTVNNNSSIGGNIAVGGSLFSSNISSYNATHQTLNSNIVNTNNLLINGMKLFNQCGFLYLPSIGLTLPLQNSITDTTNTYSGFNLQSILSTTGNNANIFLYPYFNIFFYDTYGNLLFNLNNSAGSTILYGSVSFSYANLCTNIMITLNNLQV